MNDLIIDAHQHYWQLGRFDYFWMTPERQALKRDFLPGDLAPLLSQNGVSQTIAVQAHASHAESYWLLELADAYKFISGVVGWTDLMSAQLGKALDEFQTRPKFKGIRHPLEAEPNDAWVVQPQVLKGLKELERRGIPFDLVIFPRHLPYLPQIREECPNLKLIINHLAKPRIASRQFEGWAREIEKVARLPGVWCKLSGMVTEADHHDWSTEDLRPYVKHVVSQFGDDRVMFGSDWPVCVLAASYQQVVDSLRQALGSPGEVALAKLWGRNASEVYRLENESISHSTKGVIA